MLGILGLIQVANPEVFKALNPYYAYNLLSVHPDGFSCWALCFSVLLVQKHCIRTWDCGKNIRISWIFVKITLVLNYFGQAAYLIHHEGETLTTLGGPNGNPFYLIMADWFQPIGIIIATLAAVIASQALISGSFTLINEAMRLNFWPKVK
jgi:KUP system potassium uptake protein